jgi:signal transduction histidine kinase
VFVNLLVNAAQAAAACAGPVRVEVTTRRRGDRLVAIVRDYGPGIAPEHLPRIFDAFFTTKPGDKGTGLGLSITRAIIEEHGGNISVASRVGVGTTFTIELPASPANAELASKKASAA